MSEDEIRARAAARYEACRAEILEDIRERRVSASLSGIEYFHKPWAELNPDDEFDASTIKGFVEAVTEPPPPVGGE